MQSPQEIADQIVTRFGGGPNSQLAAEIATALGAYQVAIEGPNAQLVAALRKLKPGEPFFVVRGQDSLAADTVEWWAIHAKMTGVHIDKVNSAYRIAEDMREWPKQKLAD